MLTVALTGGIGSGKSRVADQFARLGATVIDTDLLARELVLPGSATLAEIVATFGTEVLTADGALDRPLLRERVFSDPAARARLEAILHPPIRSLMLERLAAVTAPYAILVIPLLIETGQGDVADRVLVVDLPEAEQIRRVRQRDGIDEVTVGRILGAQVDRATRLAAANDIIDNSGPLTGLAEQIQQLHRHYLALSQVHPVPTLPPRAAKALASTPENTAQLHPDDPCSPGPASDARSANHPPNPQEI